MRVLAAAIGLAACLGSFWPQPAAGQPPPRRPLAGRLLADALRELQGRGLQIVFSSELVRPNMRVTSEPASRGDREILDEILKPHSLEARGGPGSTLIVVRTAAAATAAPSARGAVVRGMIVHARTATPLPGVRVHLAGAAVEEAVTGSDGRFELTGVPPGRYTFVASLVGYTLARPEIEVQAAGVQDLTVALTDGTATYTEEITVTGDPFRGDEQSLPSAMVLNGAELLQLRGVLADDPLRAIHAMPAVTGGNDFRSEFSIRGSDYRHVGLSVDGMTTDWPIHTVRDDASSGSVSLINSDVVDQVALFGGVYAQDRPARTGAWADFTIREGSRARLQVRGALSMTSASLMLEGPIGSRSRGSWLVATRQSYVQWILKRLGSDGSTAFGYTDIQGKAVYDLSPAQRLDVTVLAGRSHLDVGRVDTDPNLVGRGEAGTFLLTAGWRATRGSSLTFTQRVSAGRFGFDNDRIDGVVLAEGSGDSVAYRPAVAWAIRPSIVLQAGAYFQREALDQSSTRFIEPVPPAAPAPRTQAVHGTRTLSSADARLSYAGPRGPAIDAGVLVSSATNDAAAAAPSPWVAVTVPLGGRLSLRTAGGIYRQHPALDQTAGSFGGDEVATERATQLEAALEHRWRPSVRAQITAYRRRERDMLRLTDDDYRLVGGVVTPPSMTPLWANVLDGSSSGFEVLAQRRAVTGLSGWISYGYSRTTYDDRQTGERFSADFDQRHTFNAFGQYRISTVVSTSAKLRVGSNYPIPAYLAARDDGLFVGAERNTVRLPLYSRLDLRANRAFNFQTRRLTLFVEVVNVLGRTNYAPGYEGMRVVGNGRVVATTQRLFPFLPTAGILVEF